MVRSRNAGKPSYANETEAASQPEAVFSMNCTTPFAIWTLDRPRAEGAMRDLIAARDFALSVAIDKNEGKF